MSIDPDGLLELARELAGTGRGRPPDVNLRRGVSTAYYALFHDITALAVEHALRSAPEDAKSHVRRAWSHSDVASAAHSVKERVPGCGGRPGWASQCRGLGTGSVLDVACGAAAASARALMSSLQGTVRGREHRDGPGPTGMAWHLDQRFPRSEGCSGMARDVLGPGSSGS